MPLIATAAPADDDGEFKKKVKKMALSGYKLQAVKLIREKLGLDLKAAIKYLDE